MKISKDTQGVARRLLRLCMQDGSLRDDRVRRVSQTIIARKPRNYIALLKAFASLVSFELAKHSVVVQSAVELNEGERNDIQTSLIREHGDSLVFSWEVDPDLIGGIRIRIGDRVIDGTVRNRINKLSHLAARL